MGIHVPAEDGMPAVRGSDRVVGDAKEADAGGECRDGGGAPCDEPVMLQEVGEEMKTYPLEWTEEGIPSVRYRVWFNRVADPKEAWVVQELVGEKKVNLFTAPGVNIAVPSETKLDMTQTPQGWLECAGAISRDGGTNFINIRP